MDQFEYVMVLVSIIVGLGIAHILLGIAGIIDRRSSERADLELSLAHAAWVGLCFAWLVLFWWWEYRHSTSVAEWTIGTYLFLIFYAVTLFLLQAVLVPKSWDGVTSLKVYFLEHRVWFYSLLGFATIMDMIDSYLLGGFQFILDLGIIGIGFTLATIPVVIIGIKTTNIRIHNVMGTIFFLWQILVGFSLLEFLSP